MQLLFESLFSGVAIGSVLLTAALGLAIVFGLMGVINLAHGELIMLGAYTTYVVQLTGPSEKLDSFLQALGETEVLEVVRSGVAGMARGEKVLAP